MTSRRLIAVGLCSLVVFAAVADAIGQARRVQVGICTPLKGIEAAKEAGFDYAELGTSEIAALSDADFDRAVADLQRIGLSTPAANLFVPASIRLTGPDVNIEQQMTYVTRAFDRLARLGVTLVVFGSGGARRVPDGFAKDKAFQQLVEFGRRIAPEARRRGIVVTIEPLRRQECNIINTAAEGLELVKAIDDPNFQLMVDFYHLAVENEDPEIIVRGSAHLRHLHMANPEGRVFPLAWEEFAYAPFFASLRSIRYDRRISIEASTKDFPSEAPKAIALLRRAFEP